MTNTDREKIKEALERAIMLIETAWMDVEPMPCEFEGVRILKDEVLPLLDPQAATKPAGGVMVGDIILFNAVSGHPVYGEEQEFIGRVQKDAKGLYAANYYQHAWKNMRIIEALTRKENGG